MRNQVPRFLQDVPTFLIPDFPEEIWKQIHEKRLEGVVWHLYKLWKEAIHEIKTAEIDWVDRMSLPVDFGRAENCGFSRNVILGSLIDLIEIGVVDSIHGYSATRVFVKFLTEYVPPMGED